MKIRKAVRVGVVLGTRPEAIKLAPVVLELKNRESFEVSVISTGQHREMLDSALSLFGVSSDADLSVMNRNQSLNELLSRVVKRTADYLQEHRYDWVIVQGDTTTAFGAGLAAFHENICVAHVEAGLRTHDLYRPWPEELNRSLISRFATLHFAPTVGARQNLVAEMIDEQSIVVTGNTVVDALEIVVKRNQNTYPSISGLPGAWQKRKLVLITGHRRENLDGVLHGVCRSIRTLSTCFPDALFVFPVHLNPVAKEQVEAVLSGASSNIVLLDPLPYDQLVALMMQSALVVTDSGGIQEEAPSLGVPVLVTRYSTERPEAVDSGYVELVGDNQELLLEKAGLILERPGPVGSRTMRAGPFGDGNASGRIADALLLHSGLEYDGMAHLSGA